MDRATFERQKAFAGETKPSMQRRCVDHDYTERRMYMVTMVTEERKLLFGKVVGRSEAVEPSADVPHIELSPLGKVPQGVKQACTQKGRFLLCKFGYLTLRMMPSLMPVRRVIWRMLAP